METGVPTAEVTDADAKGNQNKSVWLIVVIAAIFLGGFYCVSFYECLQKNVALTFESHVLWFAWQFAHGQNMYSPAALQKSPFSVCIYPPLFQILAAPLVAIAGPTFFAGRLITVLSTIVSGAIFAILLKREQCSRISVVTALFFYFSFIPVWWTSLLVKSDNLSICLNALALLIFLAEMKKEKSLHIVSALLCTLGFLARQQSVVVAITIMLYLACLRRWRECSTFTGTYLVSMALTTALFQTLTGGYFQHLSYLKEVKWAWINELIQLSSLGFDGIKILVAALIIGFVIMRHRAESSRYLLPAILLVVSTALSGYSLGIPGAGSNHFIGIIFALAWVLAYALDRLPKAAVLLAVICILPIQLMYDFLNQQLTEHTKLHDEAQKLLPSNGSLLVDDPYWALETNGQSAVVDCVSFANVWKNQPSNKQVQQVVDKINAKEYSAVMINEADDKNNGGNIWPRPVVDAIHQNYKLVGRGTGNGVPQSVFVPLDATKKEQIQK